MFIYTITSPTTDHTNMFTGTLEEAKDHFAAQAHRHNWNFGDFTTWGLDAEDLEAGEATPELTAENMRKFVSTIWDIPEKNVNVSKSARSVQEVIKAATETNDSADYRRFSNDVIEHVTIAAMATLAVIETAVADGGTRMARQLQSTDWAMTAQPGDFAITINDNQTEIMAEWLTGHSTVARVDADWLIGREATEKLIDAYKAL